MTTLNRCRVNLSSFNGSPGVATFYTLDTQTITESLHAFWLAVATLMPQTVGITIVPNGDQIESTTGDIVGEWSGDPKGAIIGGGQGAYSAPSGAVVTWQTGTIVHNHRLKGRTFIVPLNGSQFESNGSLAQTTLDTLRAEALQFSISQSASLVVWSRPFAGTPAAPGRAANPARLGSFGLVTSTSVNDMAAVLRSRRD